MKLINKLKRFFYKIKNSDPVYNCKLYKEKGCELVDSIFCNHPNCPLEINFLGYNQWVCCINCKFQDECCNRQFGLGCYNGEEI